MKNGQESIQKKVFRMSWTSVFAAIVGVALFVGIVSAQDKDNPCGDNDQFTSQFRLQDCHFKTVGENPFFILKPGYQLALESDEGRVVVTVLPETQAVHLDGRKIITRVVEERESEDDTVVEISRNLFAICRETNDVFYFGEDVSVCDIDETGGFAEGSDTKCADKSEPDHGGQWRAGVNGALPGVIMPGGFLLGSKYFQEKAFADGAADRAENVEMRLDVETEAGKFKGCVRVAETNPVEEICDGGDEKVYCPGVGLVIDEDLELVEINKHAINQHVKKNKN